ncbi:MAG: TIGR03862 family flavoprotein [Hyphomicrobiales bacterium]
MKAVVVGAGPAGLKAAEELSLAGLGVTVFDRMPSPGRKFLMAGRGGLNLTHSEPLERFIARYGAAAAQMRPFVEAYPPAALIAWCEELGQPTFVGSSRRVFPKTMKASPLLRAWLRRLAEQDVAIRTRMAWTGWDVTALTFSHEDGRTERVEADVAVLALGGASWPRLGSTGAWVGLLQQKGIAVTPLEPANAGVTVAWSEHARRLAGSPLKRIAVSVGGRIAKGEAVITRAGLEGGAIYALSEGVRTALSAGYAALTIDLRPDLTVEALAARLASAKAGQSTANRLRRAGLDPAHVAVLRDAGALPADVTALAARIKACPLAVTGLAGLDRAISTAGGVAWDAVDDGLMLRAIPGTFVCGEMLDWEAPTGGYLLQGCFSTAVVAARAAAAWATTPR